MQRRHITLLPRMLRAASAFAIALLCLVVVGEFVLFAAQGGAIRDAFPQLVFRSPVFIYVAICAIWFRSAPDLSIGESASASLPASVAQTGALLSVAAVLQSVVVPLAVRYMMGGEGSYLVFDPAYLGLFVVGLLLVAVGAALRDLVASRNELGTFI